MKPVKVPVILVRHIYIDTTEPLSKYSAEMSRLFGVPTTDEITLLKQSSLFISYF